MTLKYLSVIIVLLLSGCPNGWQGEDRDFRQDMRDFVRAISVYAKGEVAGFIIIPQNGHDLVTISGDIDDTPAASYLAAIDGVGREDLYYGYDSDNVATSAADTAEMVAFLDIAEANGVQALVTDYCSTHTFMDDSYTQNDAKGYTAFAADNRDLDTIPDYPTAPYNVNSNNIAALANAENFLYLLDPSAFSTKAAYLEALQGTDYDFIIMDLYYESPDGTPVALTNLEVQSLKTKNNGGSRVVICYMSIGEAEDYRFYWKTEWENDAPEWLEAENPLWPGNYKVQYWEADWQAVIFGGADAYLDIIIRAGFDGVYLDIIDAFEYFEG